MSTATVTRAAIPAFTLGERVSIVSKQWGVYPPHTRGRAGTIVGPPRRVGIRRPWLVWPVRFGIGPSFVEVRAAHLRKGAAA